MAVIPSQSSTLLIENYLQNQCQYCLKCDLNKSRRNRQNKKGSFLVILKASISNTDPNKIKLRMLQVRLKCKQLEEKIQSIQRELKINNHKVNNGLNKDFIEMISSNSGKMTPFMKFLWEQQKRLFTSPSSWVRNGPVVICFFLYVAAKSSSL